MAPCCSGPVSRRTKAYPRSRAAPSSARTPAAELPRAARARIGIAEGQENLLVRVVLRHPTRSLAKAEANALRDRIYAALHEGSAHEWAAP